MPNGIKKLVIKRKNPEDKIEQIHMEIAASIQKIIEDITMI